MIVYDAENQILGRMSTKIAKQLLEGEKIEVVNVEKSVISGNPKVTTEAYLRKIHRGDPTHGPYFPKQVDGIFRRTVRGMLPWDRSKGREAYRNLKVFISIPEELKDKKFEKIESADIKKLKCKYITLGDLSLALGSKRRW